MNQTNETWIIGIRVADRVKNTSLLQHILTKFGCSIKTRLGLHETNEGFCSPGGLILLELTGDTTEFMKLENALLALEDVEVKKMIFSDR